MRRFGKVFRPPDRRGWYYQIDMLEPVGPHRTKADATRAAQRRRETTNDELRKIWRAAGGEFHGPHVEHGYMEEAKLLPFLRRLIDGEPDAGPG